MDIKNISLLINHKLKLNPSILIIEDTYIISFRTHSNYDLEYTVEGDTLCNTIPSEIPIGTGTTYIILCDDKFNRKLPSYDIRLYGIDGRLIRSNKQVPNMSSVFYLYVTMPIYGGNENILYEIGLNQKINNFSVLNIYHFETIYNIRNMFAFKSDGIEKNAVINIENDIIKVYDMYERKMYIYHFPPEPDNRVVHMINRMTINMDILNILMTTHQELIRQLVHIENKPQNEEQQKELDLIQKKQTSHNVLMEEQSENVNRIKPTFLYLNVPTNKLILVDTKPIITIHKSAGSSALLRIDDMYIVLTHSKIFTQIDSNSELDLYINEHLIYIMYEYIDLLGNNQQLCSSLPQYIPCRNNFPNKGIYMHSHPNHIPYELNDATYEEVYSSVMTLKYLLGLISAYTEDDTVSEDISYSNYIENIKKMFLSYLRHKLFEYSQINYQVMYSNNICKFTLDDKLASISYPFVFETCSKTGVNFSCGMEYNIALHQYIITYSVDDNISFVITIPEDIIPVYANEESYDILDMLFISNNAELHDIEYMINHKVRCDEEEKAIMIIIYRMLKSKQYIVNNPIMLTYIIKLYDKLKHTSYAGYLDIDILITELKGQMGGSKYYNKYLKYKNKYNNLKIKF